MAPPSTPTTVLVTGGSGYIGGWMIAALLKRGYLVRTTLRTPARIAAARTAFQSLLPPAEQERLSFHVADLLADQGWHEAISGVQAIMHVASPMPAGQYKGTDIIRPAREGTRRILNAAMRAGVSRVVLTSSLQAALPPRAALSQPSDERVWTDLDSDLANDYSRAKTLAEQDAWAFCQAQAGAPALTTILPGMVQGPVLQGSYSASVDLIARMLAGKLPFLPRLRLSIVDVRDLVDLHIRAMESDLAKGQRYIGTSDALWLRDVALLLKRTLGEHGREVRTRGLPDGLARLAAYFSTDMRVIAPSLGRDIGFTADKARKQLGWSPRRAAQAITASAQSLIELGLPTARPQA